MNIIECNQPDHGQAILDIFNHTIIHSTALFDYEPRPPESMDSWFKTKRKNNFPVIGVTDDTGMLAGFVTYGTFRAWPAFKYSVEHSIYIHPEHHGRGLGTLLLQQILDRAQEQEYHVLIGGIEATNTASIKLHTKMGFEYAGQIKQAGFKFGKWLDLSFYQKILKTPERPVDG